MLKPLRVPLLFSLILLAYSSTSWSTEPQDSLVSTKQRVEALMREIEPARTLEVKAVLESRARGGTGYDWAAVQPLIVPLPDQQRKVFMEGLSEALALEPINWKLAGVSLAYLSNEAPCSEIEELTHQYIRSFNARTLAELGTSYSIEYPACLLAAQGTPTAQRTLIELMTLGISNRTTKLQHDLLEEIPQDVVARFRASVMWQVFSNASLDSAEGILKKALRRVPKNSDTAERLQTLLGYLDRKQEGVECFDGIVP